MKATEKQISYLRSLLRKAGMDDRYIGRGWKKFGFGMNERSGRVEDLDKDQASRVIDALRGGK